MQGKRFFFWSLIISAALLPCSGKAQEVDYSGLEELFGEPVTTSATGKPQRISETPVSMSIITAEEIRRSGAMDIPQILQRLAGLEVMRNYKGGVDINIRGYNQPLSNRVLVLVDGRQVYLDTFGETLWANIPVELSEIKQIEVVRGPNSSLFGFNAASGVINIITFNPLYDTVKNVTLRGGTQDHRQGSTVISMHPSEQVGMRFSGSLNRWDDYSRKHMNSWISDEDNINGNSFSGTGVYKINEHSSMRVEAGLNNTEADTLVTYHVGGVSDLHTRHARVAYDNDTGKTGVVKVNAYHNENGTVFDANKFLVPIVTEKQSNKLDVIQLSDLFSPASNHSVRIGAEARNNTLQFGENKSDNAELTMRILSGNAMWDWQISEQWSFTNAIRFDHWATDNDSTHIFVDPGPNVNLSPEFGRDEWEYSFNSGLVYQATEDASYRFSVARGIRIPSLLEMAEFAPSNGFSETYGNPNLDAEENTTYEIGYSRNLPSIRSGIEANIFYEQVSNLITPVVRAPGYLGGNGGSLADLTFVNGGKSDAVGLELSGHGELIPKTLLWHLNYTYTHVNDQENDSGMLMGFDSDQPRHKVNAGLSYTYNQWEFDTDAHYVSSMNYYATTADFTDIRKTRELDDYVTLNGRIGYWLGKKTTISLDGYNLVQEHFERPTFENGLGYAMGANEIGRTVLLTLRHNF